MFKIFLLFILTINCIEAEEKQLINGKKKYNLSICSVFDHPTKFLAEWIEYHELVGVDHFYLYNNGEDSSVKQILKPFIRKGLVTLIPWNNRKKINENSNEFAWALSTQVPAYENAIYVRGARETKWLVCLDLNEYLVPTKNDKITHVLGKYAGDSGLVLCSDYFSDSKYLEDVHRLMIENTGLIFPPKNFPSREVKKIIFKPELCTSFSWPPYECKFKNESKASSISRSELRINRYIHEGEPFFENIRKKICVDHHNLTDKEVFDLLKEGYEVEDQEKAIQRFLTPLKKQMGLY